MVDPEVTSAFRTRKQETLKLFADSTAKNKTVGGYMNFKIKSISLENFKGIKSKTIEFDGKLHRIEGKNATGKTTLATAYFWVFCNTDYDLKSNPAIFPLDVEECTPSVEIEMLVDDKPVKICKKQTRKVTESNGTKKVALTNSYFVNDVPMAERDMTKKLSDLGFDFENFSILANPNAFLLEKKDIQRKILFSMVSAYTDLDIANKMDGVDEAKELLANYTADEIKAMQNATLKKITENYGKKGELLNSKIEGLELSKVDMDFAELELQKNSIKEQIEKNQDAQRVANLILADLDKIKDKQLSLQFELSGIEQKAKAEKEEQEKKLFIEKRELDEKATDLDRQIAHMKAEVQIYEDAFTHSENEKKRLEEQLKQAQAMSFDENSLLCPTCGQLFKLDKQAEIRIEFNKQKLISMGNIENAIKSNRSMLAIKKSEKADLDRKLEKAINDRAELQKAIDKPCDASEVVVNTYDEEISRLKAEIEKNKSVMDEKQSGLPNVAELKAEELNMNTQLRETEIKLSKADDNNRIDEKIGELRQLQMVYEQDRANAEKVLYQLDMIQKEKNLVATEEINKHFSLVHWKMFDYLKNGSYTETCVPMVGDKELGAALNNAMQIRAKIDICNSLQNFYNTHYPVFLDNSEALDYENQNQLVADTQLILLSVKD